jgi:hypothetical protein
VLRLAEAGRREEAEQAALDPTRAEGLLHLIVDPGEPSVLVVRNLLRGSRLGLPTGQDVAEDMGVERLAEAGLQVCVLERGKTYPPGELSSRPPPHANERLGPQ